MEAIYSIVACYIVCYRTTKHTGHTAQALSTSTYIVQQSAVARARPPFTRGQSSKQEARGARGARTCVRAML